MQQNREIVLFGERKYSAALVILALLALNIANYLYYGIGFSLVLTLSGFISLIAWIKTTYKDPISTDRELALYLLLLAVILIHLGEEYYAVSRLYNGFANSPISLDIFILVYLIWGTSLAILAAIGLIYRNPLSNFIVWFMIISSALVNGMGHIALPFALGTVYAPGSLTAPLPVLIGGYLALTLYRKTG